jgi:hypothetical protein
MFGFLATTFTIRTIMRNGFLVTGSTEVEGGIGLKATGGIKLTHQLLITLLLAVRLHTDGNFLILKRLLGIAANGLTSRKKC